MNLDDKEFEKIQCVPKGTIDHSQQQNEEDVVSIKDCISSDLKSFVTSSGDVAASFTGVHESEAVSCYSSVSTSVGVQSKTVKGSVIAKNYPKSPGLMKSNSLKSTHRNGCLTSTISKTVADTEKDIKILNKAPHLRSNFIAATPPSTYHQVENFSSIANPRCHVLSATNYGQIPLLTTDQMGEYLG
ncbi:YTH domain family protein 1 [Spatholobus suberectus]|nr:YTH domain family protein 1 [Spatholobus suberectus]